MSRATRRGAALLLAAALGACGGGGAPPGPTELRADDGPAQSLFLSWRPPAGAPSGYFLYVSVNGGAEHLVNGRAVPGEAVAVQLMPPTGVEYTALDYRVQAIVGVQLSALSNTAHYVIRPYAPAQLVAAAHRDPTTGSWWLDNPPCAPVTVSWTVRSARAKELRLERADIGPDGSRGDYAGLPLPAGASSYLDADVHPYHRYAYRVASGDDAGRWSEYATVTSEPLEIAAPSGLSAVQGAGGYQVSWTPPEGASAIELRRYGWDGYSELAVLPPGAAAFLDAVGPLLPGTWYEVAALGTGTERAAAKVAATGARVAVAGLALDGALLTTPIAAWAALNAAGELHLFRDAYGHEIYRQDGAGWDGRPLDPGYEGQPPLALDGAGHPHTATTAQQSGSPVELHHLWHDGQGWRDELAATLPTDPRASPAFGVAGDGIVHLIYVSDPFLSSFVHVVGAGGSWTSTPLALTVPLGSQPRLSVAPDGTAALVAGGELLVRPPGGDWGREPLPDAGARVVHMVAANGGAVGAIWQAASGLGLEFRLRQAGGGWGPAEPLGDAARAHAFALSADATRAHAVVEAGLDVAPRLDLRVRTDAGWVSGPLTSNGSGGALSTGYAAGKAWILVRNRMDFGATGRAALYVEP